MNNNTANKTNTVSSNVVFKSKYFSIKKVEFERNGKRFIREIQERDPIVLIIPYTQDYEIYLEKQYRTTYGIELLELAAGHINPEEEPEMAARRELKEETGLEAKSWKKVATWYISSNISQTIFVFFATELTEGKNKLDEDEIIETLKIPISKALDKALNGEINVGSHVAAILLFDKMRREGKI